MVTPGGVRANGAGGATSGVGGTGGATEVCAGPGGAVGGGGATGSVGEGDGTGAVAGGGLGVAKECGRSASEGGGPLPDSHSIATAGGGSASGGTVYRATPMISSTSSRWTSSEPITSAPIRRFFRR